MKCVTQIHISLRVICNTLIFWLFILHHHYFLVLVGDYRLVLFSICVVLYFCTLNSTMHGCDAFRLWGELGRPFSVVTLWAIWMAMSIVNHRSCWSWSSCGTPQYTNANCTYVFGSQVLALMRLAIRRRRSDKKSAQQSYLNLDSEHYTRKYMVYSSRHS